MARSRKKHNSAGLLFKLLLLVILLILAFLIFGGASLLDRTPLGRWMPGTETKDLNEWFEVSGDEVKLYFDGEATHEVTGKAAGNTVYLPLELVLERLNSRFFWSGADRMVSYTLPDETLDFDEASEIGGAPAFLQEENAVWLSLDLVEQYTNVVDERFISADEPAFRVFLYRGGSEILCSQALKKEAVRTKRDIRAPILTEMAKGDTVYVTERTDEWSRVITGDGLAGFVRTKTISRPELTVFPVNYEEPAVHHNLLDEPVVMGWHGVYNTEGNAYLDELLATAGEHINVISPTWIQISDADGNYADYSDVAYIERAHAAGLRVWACVDNFNQEGGLRDFSTRDYFAVAKKRRDFIDRLMRDAAEYGYDGINLDFENLPSDAGESFAQFFRELSVACRAASLTLSIDNYVPYWFVNHYNIEEQGVFADYVTVMLYNEHTGEPGSNASLPFTEFGILETIADVPADRVIAALPLYTRLWTVDGDGKAGSEAMSITKAGAYAEENGAKVVPDEETGQNYLEHTDGGVTKMLWLEDRDSLRSKMELIRANALGGVAVWRLGYDTPEVWEILDFDAP